MSNSIFSLIIVFSFIHSSLSFGQNGPNYTERLFYTSADSLRALKNWNIKETSIDATLYKIGPGENIFISISGIEEITHNLFVNSENWLYIPKVGGINLSGLTLAQAKDKIRLVLEKNFKNVDIYISLGALKKIKVFLVGDVQKPVAAVLESNAKLIDLFLVSEGLNSTSSFRNIRVKDLNGDVKYYDFLTFLRYGDRANNPLLNDGDVVFVDKADKIVTISGAVKFPGTYELVEGENIADLLKLAGGFYYNARLDSIELVRFDEDGKTQKSTYYTANEILQKKPQLKLKDHVIIRTLSDYFVDRFIYIKGWVKYPGLYKIEEGKTKLSHVIYSAGGFKENASIKDAYLFRTTGEIDVDPEFERLKLIPRSDMSDDEYDYLKARSRERKGKVVVDFEELFLKNNLKEDIILRRGDTISVPEAKSYVTLLGQVVNPGKVVYDPNYSVEDYIRIAGGFGWRAIEGDVRVIKSNTGEWVEDEDVESIDPGDTIWIPENPPGPKFWEVFTTTLQVLGQIAAVIAATVAVIVATR
ncbi:MAG: SLBB domain-containing protein [Ignavibacteriaceae bacterium]|nr:SLBB domain-containing protein [Ignavibacteriaceae bacterium]